MGALSKKRVEPVKERWDRRRMPMGGGTGMKAWAGGLACIDTSDGYFKPGAVATTLRAVGIFTEDVDNSAGSDGDLAVDIEFFHVIEIRWLNNDTGGGELDQSDVGSPCYVLDDQTVTGTSTGASKAGIVWAVETINGVSCVAVEFPYPAIAG